MADATQEEIIAVLQNQLSETELALSIERRNRCPNCGANTIDKCVRCGAPQCCPQCCKINDLTNKLLSERTKASGPMSEQAILDETAKPAEEIAAERYVTPADMGFCWIGTNSANVRVSPDFEDRDIDYVRKCVASMLSEYTETTRRDCVEATKKALDRVLIECEDAVRSNMPSQITAKGDKYRRAAIQFCIASVQSLRATISNRRACDLCCGLLTEESGNFYCANPICRRS